MSGDLKTWCVDANNSEGVTNMSDVQSVTMATVESMIADLERRREEVYRALREERGRLTSRIAEIDAVMAKVGASARGVTRVTYPRRHGRPTGAVSESVLAYVAGHPGCTAGQVKQATGCDGATLSRLVHVTRQLRREGGGGRKSGNYFLATATPEAAE